MAVQEQVGVGLVFEPTDAAAELVELRKAEAVGALDEDRVAVGDVEAALDDRRADEHVVAARDKVGHDPFQFLVVHLPVADGDAEVGQELAQATRHQIDRQDAVVQVEDLAAAANLVADRVDHELFVVGAHNGLNGMAVGGRRFDDAEVPRAGA